MGGCIALREGDMEDGGGDFLVAALRDDVLAATLLMCLSRTEVQVPFPPEPPRRLHPKMKWQRKGSRSRTITMEGIRAAEKEEAARASPTTPLSWSGAGSGTSGSVCGGGAPSQRRKRPRGHERGVPETKAEGKRIQAPPAKSPKPEPCQSGEPAPMAPGSSTSSGSNKMLAAAAPPAARDPASSSPVAHVEPLRWRPPPQGTDSAGFRRPGKKKSAAELQAMRETLLQDQAGLRKDLELQKAIHRALLEENMRLKGLQSSVSLHVEGGPSSTPVVCEEAELEQPQHAQATPESETAKEPCTASAAAEEGEEERPGEPQGSAPTRTFLLDLNCIPDHDL